MRPVIVSYEFPGIDPLTILYLAALAQHRKLLEETLKILGKTLNLLYIKKGVTVLALTNKGASSKKIKLKRIACKDVQTCYLLKKSSVIHSVREVVDQITRIYEEIMERLSLSMDETLESDGVGEVGEEGEVTF